MIEKVIEFLDKECRRQHYYCDDSWYTCPMYEDGCANDNIGPECNCGTEKFNKELDKVIEELREWNDDVWKEMYVIQDNLDKTKKLLKEMYGEGENT